MIIIGLTGNFGTGKSTVSGMLAELGACVIDADRLGHELFESRGPAYDEVVAAFGSGILGADGGIDRQKLGRIVFASPPAVARLNQIMHPRILEVVRQRAGQAEKQGAKVVVVEAALLIEAGWRHFFDRVWVTVAPERAIIDRLKRGRGIDEEQVLTRLQAQMPSQEKEKLADVVIDTGCSLDELKAELARLWQKLEAEAETAPRR